MQQSAISNQQSAKSVRRGFTLIELLATVAVVAVLAVAAVVYIPAYMTWAQNVADQRTLTILNDALTRYKTEGGNLAALTAGAYPGHIVALLQQPLNWAGTTHQVIQSGSTYPGRSLSATGNGSNYQFTAYNSYMNIAGGTSGNNASHGVQSFTSTGTTTWTVPAGVNFVEVLAVAGGGGGGSNYGAGGGGGGVIHQTGYNVTPGASITVTVGAGGAGTGGPGFSGLNGSNSVFGGLTAIGGGCGGGTSNTGGNGGSGGGGSSGSAGGSGTANQGNNGSSSGGGGGAGASASSKNGGNGLQFSISGTPTYYGGGGGSGGNSSSGGLGGGGGAPSYNSYTSGTANTGGGGSGQGGCCGGGSGGSGIVIISY